MCPLQSHHQRRPRRSCRSQRRRFWRERATRHEVDFGKVMERMRKLRSDISQHDSVQRFASLGIDVFFGQATDV